MHAVDAVLAFAAALVSLRLAAEMARRARRRSAPELSAWAISLGCYAIAAAALAAGAAGGWHDATFRVYYLFGGLLTAPLFGVGSLLLVRQRWAAPVGLLYAGLAAGVAIAMPLRADVEGTSMPHAQDLLDVFPARILAVAANSLGTLAVVGVAAVTFRQRPRGNVLILAGVAAAAIGSGIPGLGAAGTAVFLAVAAALLYLGVTRARAA